MWTFSWVKSSVIFDVQHAIAMSALVGPSGATVPGLHAKFPCVAAFVEAEERGRLGQCSIQQCRKAQLIQLPTLKYTNIKSLVGKRWLI